MSAKRTLQRKGWLITCESDVLSIARSEHSDWIEVPLGEVSQLINDLREIADAASPRRTVAECLADLKRVEP